MMLTSKEVSELIELYAEDIARIKDESEYDGSDIPSGSYCTSDGCWLPSQDGVFDFESEF